MPMCVSACVTLRCLQRLDSFGVRHGGYKRQAPWRSVAVPGVLLPYLSNAVHPISQLLAT
eukprot:1593100-Amphidinium_carterae.1